MVTTTIGHQAFIHDRCNLFPGLSSHKANNTVLNTTLRPKSNLRSKLWKGLGPPVIEVTVKKDSLVVYVLTIFGILAGRCGSVVVREKDEDMKLWIRGPGSILSWAVICILFNINTLNNR